MFASPTKGVGQTDRARHAASAEPVYLIVRSDDRGMSHSVNMALDPLIATGVPLSAPVMFYRQVELELRAQIDRAVRSGLRIDYADYHMGTMSRDTLRARNVKLISYRQLIEMQG